jgi:predicted nucleic-acid-binding protein
MKPYNLYTNYLIYYFQNEAKVLSEIKQKYEKEKDQNAGYVITSLIINGA